MDYFNEVVKKLHIKKQDIEILECDIQLYSNNYNFELFKFGLSDNLKDIYNSYEKFYLKWENRSSNIRGFVRFIPFERIFLEHRELKELVNELDNDLIDEQDEVIEDISHWYPIFIFPNGDKFCYDDRDGKIVFFEHDVFDCGMNLHGLVIAETIDNLFLNWSKVLFVDIYDWYEGVNESGIDINKDVYKPILNMYEDEVNLEPN